MKNVILAAAAVMLAACAMPQGGRKMPGGLFGNLVQPAQEAQSFVDEAVEVVTEPAGARIQVNDAFVGYSPVKALARRYWRGSPGNMALDPVKIEALPAAGGQCMQGGLFGEGSGRVPSPVNFNMTACSAAPPFPAPARRKK